jgi:hypothetical protein
MNLKLLQLTFYAIIISLTIVTATLLAATNVGLPDEVVRILSVEAAAQVAVVIGSVTAVKNLFPSLKGFIAVVFTLVSSLTFGIIQYGVGADSIWHGLVIGSVAAYTFFVTNNFGKLMSNGNEIALSTGWRQIISIVKYILARFTK